MSFSKRTWTEICFGVFLFTSVFFSSVAFSQSPKQKEPQAFSAPSSSNPKTLKIANTRPRLLEKALSVVPTSERPKKTFWAWLIDFSPILVLLITVAIVISRLPRIELGHSDSFRTRRIFNWLPLGLTYAFLYMGRYNLTVAKSSFGDLMSLSDFSVIFAVGTVTYGFSFLINGPLTDRLGGRFAILMGAAGAAVMNFLMGLITYWGVTSNLVVWFSLLYAGNMYFQSFGAVAIVKINASWFHVRERGVFGAIFGILISLGIFFAFDIGGLIVKNAPTYWVFWIPSLLLALFWILDALFVKNTPKEANHKDFDTEDASSGEGEERLPVLQVFKRMMSNPIIITIALVEFCSGFMRQSIMNYYRIFAKMTQETTLFHGYYNEYVYKNWGLLLCCAGILGGVFAGILSDRIFHSRRGPVAGVLYGLLFVGSCVANFLLGSSFLGWAVILMSLCVIGVHGMLSGTASMDFGGKKNVGVAVGIIDGFVYLGTGFMAVLYSFVLPSACLYENAKGTFISGKQMYKCYDRILEDSTHKKEVVQLFIEQKQSLKQREAKQKKTISEAVAMVKKTSLQELQKLYPKQTIRVFGYLKGKLAQLTIPTSDLVSVVLPQTQVVLFQEKNSKSLRALLKSKKGFGSFKNLKKKQKKQYKSSYIEIASITTKDSNVYRLKRPGTQPSNWGNWPLSMVPISMIGFLLALRVWNAKPKGKKES